MRSLGKESGLSLVEAVAAMAIFAMAVTGILQGFLFSYSNARLATLKTVAMARAQERMEEMKNDACADVTTTEYPSEMNLTLYDAGTVDTSDDILCNRTVSVTPDTATAVEKTIAVAVDWTFKERQWTEAITSIISP